MPDVQRIADVPLDDLFPALGDAARVRMIQVADRLDRARVPHDRPWWRWSDQSVTPIPESPYDPMPLLVGSTLTVDAAPNDHLELSLGVYRALPQFLIVIADVDVGCHCATDHERHTVQRREWLAGTGDALADAFDVAAETVRGWLGGPRVPAAWRARAGLPNPGRQPSTAGDEGEASAPPLATGGPGGPAGGGPAA